MIEPTHFPVARNQRRTFRSLSAGVVGFCLLASCAEQTSSGASPSAAAPTSTSTTSAANTSATTAQPPADAKAIEACVDFVMKLAHVGDEDARTIWDDADHEEPRLRDECDRSINAPVPFTPLHL